MGNRSGIESPERVALHHDHDREGAPPTCPECGERFAELEQLAPHLERHREVLPADAFRRGELRGRVCAKGCGRWLPWRARRDTVKPEWRDHEQICDGKPPLPPGRLAMLTEMIQTAAKLAPCEPPPWERMTEEIDTMGDETCEKCGKTGVDGRHTSKCGGPKPEGAKERRPRRPRAASVSAQASGNGMPGLIEHMLAEAKALRERASMLEEMAEKLEGAR